MNQSYLYMRFLLSFCAIFLFSCQENPNEDKESQQETGKDQKQIILNVNDEVTYQTIDHFGASDAWSTQFVGNWPADKKEAIADLLFSQELDEAGNPEGIGLSLWRFNVGAGSAEQGDESGISDEWRRAESFLKANGEYDWEKQKGQVWFAQAAQSRGVDKLLIFPNSPPIHMTRNGKAFADNGVSNLAPEQFEGFAVFLADVAEGLERKGLDVDYISPVNEPQWDWSDGGQEGTSFRNREIATIVRELNQELEDRKLDIKIDIAEAGKIDFLYKKEENKRERSNQIQEFFVEGSENYIGDLSHVGRAISGHSYFTSSPFSSAVEQREKLSEAVSQIPGLKFWMSEYCILGDNYGEMNGNGRDLGIDPALYVARVIHNDLAVAQAAAWHWWLAVSPYDYKDGLVYIDYQKENGEYYESKMLWALGNYSRFVRPGYQRISITNPEKGSMDKNFLFSGYKNPDTGELVFVVVNSGTKDVDLELEFGGDQPRTMVSYVTSSEKDLEFQKIKEDKPIAVPARSIMTITTQSP